ncbi:peptidoglycan recognition protein family protein [Streptomyces johnsoniae]|uniref:Peptidoglycan recognition family protein n=1 Tax=Streptomyces johnsoniae TaxID=3075532 RepID=A0ABU2S8M0_9ACTN|nr:peptidoglycan recognition family protein [Streptomyces sp. DSM 41886]MDT0444015.1 peptidoglycan recognition family protein [Streptomyces sp. DSM 41886]
MVRDFSIRRRLLFAAAAGTAAAVALPGAASAAQAVEPDIDGTAQWNARPPGGNISVLPYRPSMIVVHHTVSDNTSDFSRAQAHSHAHWVQDLHMDGNGWVDTGYNFLVSRGGWITEGRHRSLEALNGGTGFVFGAHTSGQNDRGIGIANEGAYHDGATPPAAQWDVLVGLCAYVCQQYAVPPTEIYGHKDFGNTLCPGVLHDMLPQLREEVAGALG